MKRVERGERLRQRFQSTLSGLIQVARDSFGEAIVAVIRCDDEWHGSNPTLHQFTDRSFQIYLSKERAKHQDDSDIVKLTNSESMG